MREGGETRGVLWEGGCGGATKQGWYRGMVNEWRNGGLGANEKLFTARAEESLRGGGGKESLLIWRPNDERKGVYS